MKTLVLRNKNVNNEAIFDLIFEFDDTDFQLLNRGQVWLGHFMKICSIGRAVGF